MMYLPCNWCLEVLSILTKKREILNRLFVRVVD